MARKSIYYLKFWARRKNLVLIPFFILLMWYSYSWLSIGYNNLTVDDQVVEAYRYNRNLSLLMTKTKILIEPEYSIICQLPKAVPILVMVASAPENFEERHAIRTTWGKYLPTYFVLGLFRGVIESSTLTQVFFNDHKVEAEQYKDIILFDHQDGEQNLTLKTALMMKWVLDRCPHATFVLKTEDDVLVNPWILKNVCTENRNAKLIGFVQLNTTVSRSMFEPHYTSYWLYEPDVVPQHLDGSAYIMRVNFLPKLLQAAYQVPIINLEYVYFTYLVAYKAMEVKLKHDWRVNPNKPWFNMSCAYRYLATTHKYGPVEMSKAWAMVESNMKNKTDCSALYPFVLAKNWLLT